MANDFSRIGFSVASDDDLQRLYAASAALLRRTETPEGTAEVLAADGAAELWFYGLPGERVQPELCEPCLRTERAHRVCVRGLFGSRESPCPVLELKYESAAGGFALPMLLLDHLAGTSWSEGSCLAKPSLFAQTLRIYEDREEFLERQSGSVYCPSVIPWMDPARRELREPLARMTGFTAASELRVNPLTGLAYAVLTLDCFGFLFPVAVDLRQLDRALPKPGGVLSGTFWISGTAEGGESA